MTDLEQLQQWIDRAQNIVFFGGAGVSTESGMPDFRSQDGLYRQQWKYPPETVFSRSFFRQHPEEFFEYYRTKMMPPDLQPNAAHRKLAELEQAGKLLAVITQNIDGLHQAAGSRKVLELHGSVDRNYCTSCGAFYGADRIRKSAGIPRCTCGGIIKPAVVLYEEELDSDTLEEALEAIQTADLLLVGGTSLNVYPAAGLIRYFQGEKLVLLNREPTAYDRRADLILRDPIGQVLGQIQVR